MGPYTVWFLDLATLCVAHVKIIMVRSLIECLFHNHWHVTSTDNQLVLSRCAVTELLIDLLLL